MSKRTILIVAAGALLLGGAVAAISAPGHRGGHHGMWSDDQMMPGGEGGHGMRGRFGGALTKDAFDARTRESFARLDKNSDGVIDPTEIEASINERMASRHGRMGAGDGMMGERMLRHLGAGPDGKVTKDGYRAEITRRFAEMDLNNDGRIDDNDLPPMMRGRHALSAGGMGHGGRMMGGLAALGVTPRDGAISRDDVLAAADKQFARLDKNNDGVIDKSDTDALRKESVDYRVKRFAHHFGAGADGRVTRDQFQAKAAERFARMDVNGDGTIARDERPGHGGMMGGRMRHGMKGGGMMGPDHGMGPAGGPGGMMGNEAPPPAKK